MNRARLLLFSLVVFILSVSVLYPITQMFFLRDDFTILYKIQQHETLLPPYQNIITFFTPLYQWFGLEPRGYYSLAVFLYGISTVAVLLFFVEIAPVLVAVPAALLYGSGLIALENMIQVMYADAIPVLVILLTLSLACFIRYAKTGKAPYIVLSIVLFWVIHDWFAHRGQLAYVSLLVTDLFFLQGSIVKRGLRQLPFLIIALLTYGPTQPTGILTNGIQLAGALSNYGRVIIEHGSNVFANFANLVLVPLDVLWPMFAGVQTIFRVIIGTLLILTSFVGIIASWKKHKTLSHLHLYSLLLTLLGLVAYFFFNPEFVISGISRYHVYTQLSVALYIASGLLLFGERVTYHAGKMFISLIFFLYIFTSFVATYAYLSTFNRDRSVPTKKFYQDLKAFLPALPQDALLYIDQTNTLPYDPTEFMRVGRLPTEAAFAAMYGIPRENLRYTDTFADVAEFIRQHPEKPDTIYSFYIGQSGLIDTTSQVRSWFSKQQKIINLSQDWQTTKPAPTEITRCPTGASIGIPPTLVSTPLNIPSVTPVTVRLAIRISPIDLRGFVYPYFQQGTNLENLGEEYTCETTVSTQPIADTKIQRLIAFENDTRTQPTARVSASSSLPHDPASNATDKDIRTSWIPNITQWSKNHKEELSMELPKQQTINRIIIIPGHQQRLPTAFTVSARQGINGEWQTVATVTDAEIKELQPYEVSFDPIIAQSVRLTITQTNTRLAPQLAEIELVEPAWNDVSFLDLSTYQANPYAFVATPQIAQLLFESWQTQVPLRLYWKRDKDWDFAPENYVAFPAVADGTLHTYDVRIPAGGLTIEKLQLMDFIIPSIISINK